MSKSVLISIQPYYVFLIIAKTMGWDIPQEKTIEVRKTIPKDKDWDKKAIIYCSKNKKSFAKIPKEYQPLMERFSGRVIGEFVCDKIDEIRVVDTELMRYITVNNKADMFFSEETCLSVDELYDYLWPKKGYGFHISDLVIYDKPKELSDFRKPCIYGEESDVSCFSCDKSGYRPDMHIDCFNEVTRPPQSWCYVEELI